jgi:hypothetical protein
MSHRVYAEECCEIIFADVMENFIIERTCDEGGCVLC